MKRILLTSTCVAGLAVMSHPASAQDAAGTTPQAGTAQSGQPAAVDQPNPGDIIVTAQRRAESLQRAAVAASAVSGDALQRAGITRPTELTALIPALQVAPSAGPYNLFYIRGVGNFNGNALSDSALAFNFDGVFIGRPSATTGFFYDLDRVEVVKGPQGTLYGRNATGGAINVISKRPELNKFGVEGAVEYGNYSELRLDGVVNAPIGSSAAIRVAGFRIKHDGYMNDGTDNENDYGGRISLRAEPSSNLRITIVADYFHQGGRGQGATPILAPKGVVAPGAISPDDRIGFFSPQGQSFYTSQVAGTLGRTFYPFPAGYQQFQRNHAWGVSGTLDWDTPVGTVTLIPAHRENHLDYLSYVPGFQVAEIGTTKQDSVEARLATPETHPLRAIAGAFYYRERTNSQEAYASNWNGQYDPFFAQHTTSKAVYGRLVYAIVPEVRFNAGARETWEDKSFVGQRISLTRVCLAPACPTAPPLPFGTTAPQLGTFPSVLVPGFGAAPYGGFPDVLGNPALAQFATLINPDNSLKTSKFTWRVGADWDVTPHNLVYASYETGFKAGGFYFSPLASQSSYRPEQIRAFTLGSKNRFFDNKLQINAELFYWRYKDQQISHLVTIAGAPTFATENVGKASMKGVEIEARLAVTPTTILTTDVQYLDAEYKQFVYRQSNSANATSLSAFNGTGCATIGFDAAVSNSFIVNCGGNRPPFAPKWTINIGGEQRVPVSFGEFELTARAHYQTRTWVGLEYLPVENQPGYWLVDGGITWFAPQRRYFVGAFINNMFDQTVKSQIFPTPGTAFFSATIRPPRTYGVRAGVKF